MRAALYAHIIITSGALVRGRGDAVTLITSPPVLKRILVFTRLQTTGMNFARRRRAETSFPTVYPAAVRELSRIKIAK